MKAIVMFPGSSLPELIEDFEEPQTKGEDQLLIDVHAAAIKNLDKSMASGTHYSVKNDVASAKVIGGDGVGVLEDGTRIFALGVTGMLAGKAVVDKNRMVVIPDNMDAALAAALPNAIAGSAMALRYRAGIKAGDTVLINGATGFTGRIAVQIAKYYGAKTIIATGRDRQSLESLLHLGANEIVSLKQDDESVLAQLRKIHQVTPFDIVIDYVWGHTTEMILEVLKGQGSFTHRTRYVSVGSMAGDKIQLSAEVLRSTDIHLTGSGMGSWTREQMNVLLTEILPETLQLAADGKLEAEIQTVTIDEIEKIWNMNADNGKRLVVVFK